MTSGNALTTLSFVLPYREIQRAYGNRRFSQAKRDASVTHEPATYGGHIRGMTLRERERKEKIAKTNKSSGSLKVTYSVPRLSRACEVTRQIRNISGFAALRLVEISPSVSGNTDRETPGIPPRSADMFTIDTKSPNDKPVTVPLILSFISGIFLFFVRRQIP